MMFNTEHKVYEMKRERVKIIISITLYIRHSGMVSDYEPVNNLILVLMATDNDEGPDGTLSFSITKGNTDYFQLRQISNSVAHLETKHSPIEPNEYIVEVTVRDHGTPSKSDTAIVVITSIASNEIQCNQSIFGK